MLLGHEELLRLDDQAELERRADDLIARALIDVLTRFSTTPGNQVVDPNIVMSLR